MLLDLIHIPALTDIAVAKVSGAPDFSSETCVTLCLLPSFRHAPDSVNLLAHWIDGMAIAGDAETIEVSIPPMARLSAGSLRVPLAMWTVP